MDVTTAVRRWRLEPHPEGGFYRETYRSGLRTGPPGWPGERALATAILYLLPAGVRSAWHRVRGDELWLWQGGAPMALFIQNEARQVGDEARQVGDEARQVGDEARYMGDEARQVGPDPAAGQELQVLVPAGAWQSATPAAIAGTATTGTATPADTTAGAAGPGGAEPWSLVACLVAPGFDFADFELRGES